MQWRWVLRKVNFSHFHLLSLLSFRWEIRYCYLTLLDKTLITTCGYQVLTVSHSFFLFFILSLCMCNTHTKTAHRYISHIYTYIYVYKTYTYLYSTISNRDLQKGTKLLQHKQTCQTLFPLTDNASLRSQATLQFTWWKTS